MALEADDLDACYRRVEARLFNVLFRMLWDSGQCQDLMHDAFLRLWDGRARLDPRELDALAWTTALNLARNRLRWNALRQFVGLETLDELQPPLDTRPETLGELARLRVAMCRLAPAEREILLLSEVAGFDTSELAALLRIAPGTVGSRKSRALSRLRAALGQDPDDAR